MNNTIFTTGAFLKAVEIELNGIKQWRWVVENFIDENFQDGNPINVYTYANTLDDLLIQERS